MRRGRTIRPTSSGTFASASGVGARRREGERVNQLVIQMAIEFEVAKLPKVLGDAPVAHVARRIQALVDDLLGTGSESPLGAAFDVLTAFGAETLGPIEPPKLTLTTSRAEAIVMARKIAADWSTKNIGKLKLSLNPDVEVSVTIERLFEAVKNVASAPTIGDAKTTAQELLGRLLGYAGAITVQGICAATSTDVD